MIEYHFYISDDYKVNDNLFLQHCFRLDKQLLQSKNYPLPIKHIVFPDGCSSQFKCARSFFNVSHYPSLTKCQELPLGTYMQWNYFDNNHGKGRWDGVGASIKQALRAKQVKPLRARLHNALDVVSFL